MPTKITDQNDIIDLETRLAADNPKRITDPKDIADLNSRAPKSDWSQEMVSGIPIVGAAFDKAVAASNAVIKGGPGDFSERYRQQLANQLLKHEEYGKEHPVAQVAEHVAGNALIPINPTGAAAGYLGLGGPMIQRIAAGGASGAAIGGADAALRGQDVTTGGLVGGSAGAAAPVVGSALGHAYRYLRDTPLGGELADLGRGARRMIGKAFADATPESLQAARETLGPNAFAGELTQGGMDLTRGIAGGADQAAHDVRASFNERFAGQPQRIDEAVTQNLGNRVNIPQTLDQIVRERSASAKPLYDSAFARPVPQDPRLLELMQHPDIQAGMARGVKDAQTEALAKGQQFNPSGWQYLASGKIGLDRTIADSPALTDQLTGRLTNQGRVTSMLRDAYVSRLDELNPEYKAARAAWEGPTKVLGAVKEGQKALTRSIDHNDIAQDVARLNASERDGYRLGMRNSIAVLMDGARGGDTQARNLLLSRAGQAKIGAVFGEDRAESLVKSLQHEVNIGQRTTQVVPNWATGASNVSREEARALANPPSAVGEWAKNLSFSQPQAVLGAGLSPHAAVDAWTANANAQARQQLAPVLTRSANDDALLRALYTAKERAGTLNQRATGISHLATRAAAGAGRQVGKRYMRDDTVH